MKYLELGVEINPVWSEFIAEILINQIGCAGVVTEEIEYKDEAVIKANISLIKGYLWFNENSPPDIKQIQEILQQSKQQLISTGILENGLGSWDIYVKETEDEEWAHSWKKFWHPSKVGSKIIICPSWESCEIKDDEIILEIDPGTAFGTGTHPTTRLCMIALEKHIHKNDQIADIGTGSGILAISAIKLGASRAIGVDNDPSVIEVAKENAAKNNVTEKTNFYEGTSKNVEGKFNIVVANILAEVIVDIMEDLASLGRTNGKMILSGIICEKLDLVREAVINKGLSIVEVLEEQGWVAIIAQK